MPRLVTSRLAARSLLLCLSLTLSAGSAGAAGINLAFNECADYFNNGNGARSNVVWACDANTGAPFVLFGSFYPPANVDQFLGIDAKIQIWTASATLPDWWRHGPGECRSTNGLSVGFDFTSNTGCYDAYAGQAAGGFAYDIGVTTPDKARLHIQCAIPFDNRVALDPNQPYYAFKASLQRSKSTGPGACAGCSQQACLILDSIQLFQPPEADFDPVITNPAVVNFAWWQQDRLPNCPAQTPARSSSWGQVKSLYR